MQMAVDRVVSPTELTQPNMQAPQVRNTAKTRNASIATCPAGSATSTPDDDESSLESDVFVGSVT
jgi:hypothetical protein